MLSRQLAARCSGSPKGHGRPKVTGAQSLNYIIRVCFRLQQAGCPKIGLILKAKKNVGTFYAIAASVELIRWHKLVFVQERDKIRENRCSRVASSPVHLTVPVSDSWEQERDNQQILTSATVSFFVPCWKLPKLEMCFYLRVSREVTLETLMGDTNEV